MLLTLLCFYFFHWYHHTIALIPPYNCSSTSNTAAPATPVGVMHIGYHTTIPLNIYTALHYKTFSLPYNTKYPTTLLYNYFYLSFLFPIHHYQWHPVPPHTNPTVALPHHRFTIRMAHQKKSKVRNPRYFCLSYWNKNKYLSARLLWTV